LSIEKTDEDNASIYYTGNSSEHRISSCLIHELNTTNNLRTNFNFM